MKGVDVGFRPGTRRINDTTRQMSWPARRNDVRDSTAIPTQGRLHEPDSLHRSGILVSAHHESECRLGSSCHVHTTDSQTSSEGFPKFRIGASKLGAL